MVIERFILHKHFRRWLRTLPNEQRVLIAGIFNLSVYCNFQHLKRYQIVMLYFNQIILGALYFILMAMFLHQGLISDLQYIIIFIGLMFFYHIITHVVRNNHMRKLKEKTINMIINNHRLDLQSCPICGYDLTHLPKLNCAECGYVYLGPITDPDEFLLVNERIEQEKQLVHQISSRSIFKIMLFVLLYFLPFAFFANHFISALIYYPIWLPILYILYGSMWYLVADYIHVKQAKDFRRRHQAIWNSHFQPCS